MQKINVFSLLLTLSILIGSVANAQVKKLEIKNITNCDAFISLGMSIPSSAPTCALMYGSSVIMVPAGGVLYFGADEPPTSPYYVPGLPAGYIGYILTAKVYNGPTACMTTGGQIGESSCGYLAIDALTMVRDLSCNPCSAIKFKWTTMNPFIDAAMLIY